jgi:hypothetical protein
MWDISFGARGLGSPRTRLDGDPITKSKAQGKKKRSPRIEALIGTSRATEVVRADDESQPAVRDQRESRCGSARAANRAF